MKVIFRAALLAAMVLPMFTPVSAQYVENDEPYTTSWPQWGSLNHMLFENNRLLNIIVHNEDKSQVILESMRVQGKIRPHTEARIEGDSVVTDCFLLQFLGLSGFRPIPEGGVIHDQYTVEYDKVDGSHVVLTGWFCVGCLEGDVNLDGEINMADVIFMSDYLFSDSRACEIEQLMDIDANGTLDIRDMSALIDIVSE